MLSYTSNPQIRLLAGMIAASALGGSHFEAVKLTMRPAIMSGFPKAPAVPAGRKGPVPLLSGNSRLAAARVTAQPPRPWDTTEDWKNDPAHPWYHKKPRYPSETDVRPVASVLGDFSTLGLGLGLTEGESSKTRIDGELFSELARVSGVPEEDVTWILTNPRNVAKNAKKQYNFVVDNFRGDEVKRALQDPNLIAKLPVGQLKTSTAENAFFQKLTGERATLDVSLQRLCALLRKVQAQRNESHAKISAAPTGNTSARSTDSESSAGSTSRTVE